MNHNLDLKLLEGIKNQRLKIRKIYLNLCQNLKKMIMMMVKKNKTYKIIKK